jgi:hypothetical protein
LTSVHPANSTDPSSIIVSNESALPVTSVGVSALHDLFYLNNFLVSYDIIQNILSVQGQLVFCCGLVSSKKENEWKDNGENKQGSSWSFLTFSPFLFPGAFASSRIVLLQQLIYGIR